MRQANDGFRFVLELVLLAAVAYWGWWEGRGVWSWVLVVAAPLAVALVWGRVLAPKSTHRVADPWRLVFELLLFGAGVAALARAGDGIGAIVFGLLVATHLALTFALDQRSTR